MTPTNNDAPRWVAMAFAVDRTSVGTRCPNGIWIQLPNTPERIRSAFAVRGLTAETAVVIELLFLFQVHPLARKAY